MIKGNTIFNTNGFNTEKTRTSLDLQFNLENKIRDLEIINKNIFNEKQKFEIEFKVLLERHNELKQTHDSLESKFNLLKNKQVDVFF